MSLVTGQESNQPHGTTSVDLYLICFAFMLLALKTIRAPLIKILALIQILFVLKLASEPVQYIFLKKYALRTSVSIRF